MTETPPRHEEWRAIAEFPNYEVSNLGRVRMVRILKTHPNHKGYEQVGLYGADAKQYHRSIHRLVAKAFKGEPAEGLHAAHLDGNKTNNFADNLDWATPVENAAHKRIHGTQWCSIAPHAKLTPEAARAIFEDASAGVPVVDLCRKHGVTSRAVRDIRDGRAWAWLNLVDAS